MTDRKRIESDSVGSMELPTDVLYGVQSLRGKINFDITGQQMRTEQINALAMIKKAAAITNNEAGDLDDEKTQAIIQACDEIIDGQWHDQFIIDPIQGGAGTSANMNANEVIANRAGQILGDEPGNYAKVHPNDHVNMSQSTNDVYPTSGKIAVIFLVEETLKKLQVLHDSLMEKAEEFDDIIKVARTQLQDAVPIRLGQSFGAFASALERDINRLKTVESDMRITNLGGTAVGTCINASQYYVEHIADNLSKVTGLDIVAADDLVDATQNLDAFVLVSGIIKTAAVNMSKMANDLRLLSSGPRTGMAEINLPARQNGSSIMPGKINPVIPEVVTQVAFNIIGNDMTVTMAAEAGQLELNAFEPVLLYNLFESITTLGAAAETLSKNCINGITANREHCKDLLDQSLALITALCPHIGYKRSADIAHEAMTTDHTVRDILHTSTDLSDEELDKILDPLKLTHPFLEEEK